MYGSGVTPAEHAEPISAQKRETPPPERRTRNNPELRAPTNRDKRTSSREAGSQGGSMRLDQEEQSSNVEDRRGARFSPGLATGGIGTLAIVLIGLFFGIDPTVLLQGTSVDTNAPPASTERGADSNDPMKDFVARVLGSTERTWSEIFARNGRTYQPPKLVLFSGGVQSACGFAQTAAGPFYCPEDYKVYIDLEFYRELRDRFQLPVILPRLT
jgi:predicted metalloprotease